jgi:uncharacterized protein (TIGR03435 family)
VDEAGLKGKFDFTLKWSPDDGATQTSDGDPPAATNDASGPSIFTAIQEQLGLKLKSAHRRVQCLVIDHVGQPSEN